MKTLYRGGSGEIVEKKSRFIATFETIESEEDALAFIGRMKKQYWDARHNCYAFVAGENQNLQRCSDDGEPAGTAGRPMLDVLLKEDIYNAAVVVTRYFGGTLLGTGGLVRAYQKAVQEGLKNSAIIEKIQGRGLKIDCGYDSIGKIQYILAKNQMPAIGTSYTDRVVTELVIPTGQVEKLKQEITEATNGTAGFCDGELAEFAMVDGQIKIF